MKNAFTNPIEFLKKRLVFCIAMLLFFSIPKVLNAQGFTNQTRALYIMDISKYVEWPENVMQESDYFEIAVLTNNIKLVYELEALSKNRKTIQGKEIRLMSFRDVNMIEPSRVLYVDSKETYDIDKVLHKLEGKHTLLIGEDFEFRKVMMNFVVIDDYPHFEVNEALLNKEGMSVKPIFLAQAVKSREDWEELFNVTEVELEEEKVVTEQQRVLIAEQNQEIEKQLQRIAIQQARLDSLNRAIKNKQKNLRIKEKELQKYLSEIKTQKNIMAGMAIDLKKIENEKAALEDNLVKSKTELQTNINRNNELADQIKIQLKEIEKQKLITYFISIFLLLMIGLAYFVYVNYKNKKKANIALEEKNALITNQKEEIKKQRDVAEMQRDQITYQKKHITDSIEYAKRIQTAILPSLELFSDDIEHFVLYKPRDIVSGDFYWVHKMGTKQIIIAADCTGHGVPGAFMSMLGVSLLNEIIINKGIYHPDEILNYLRADIISSLKQVKGGSDVKDGMDMTVCTLDYKTNSLEFAGANNPLILFSDGEITQIKPDKMPVAVHENMGKFTLHKLSLKKGDSFYTFSDGFVDQFGGPKQKKFLSKNFRSLLSEIQDKNMIEQGKILDQTFEDWRKEVEQIDDVTVIGVRY